MRVPIDRAEWSNSSQRSLGHYDERATEYEGIACRCRRCEVSFVLTAEEQQQAYEVEKKYILWLPRLCNNCYSHLRELRVQDHEFQTKWNLARDVLRTDRKFITGLDCNFAGNIYFGEKQFHAGASSESVVKMKTVLAVDGQKRSVADNVSPATDTPYYRNCRDPMNELMTADSRALHEPFSAVLAGQSRDDAFRWITSVLSVQSSNLRSSNSHLVAYTGSDLALNWFESHVGSPVSSHWGDGAALLGAPWPRIAAWLVSDRPLAMMALDALIAFRNPAPNMAPLAQIAAPVLAQPPSSFEFEQAVLNVLKTHDTPRIKTSVEAVLRNSAEILRGGRRGVAVYDLPMLFINPGKFHNAAAILDRHTSMISGFRKSSMHALIGKSGLN